MADWRALLAGFMSGKVVQLPSRSAQVTTGYMADTPRSPEELRDIISEICNASPPAVNDARADKED